MGLVLDLIEVGGVGCEFLRLLRPCKPSTRSSRHRRCFPSHHISSRLGDASRPHLLSAGRRSNQTEAELKRRRVLGKEPRHKSDADRLHLAHLGHVRLHGYFPQLGCALSKVGPT